ncbi:MAG TPA: hypothetical protein VIG47_00380 [Gemmatimonadaceae bacterium]
MNPYQVQVERVLPRLLALYDRNQISPTRGFGDRYRWAWKLIDFGNATFQGACHGLARLAVAGLLPEYISERAAIDRIQEMIDAAARLCDRDGSVGEAFPHESSFCVTALVAHDVLAAIELLGPRLQPAHLNTVEPMIRFLERTDETHATISNHLATAVSALVRWHALTASGGLQRAESLLRRLLEAQDADGWFREYWGADPGYQTLTTHYLADAHRLRPELNLLEPLGRSLQFLCHFAHADGSFGGLYGSRNTRFLAPGGIEALAGEIPEAAALSLFARRAIAARSLVTLETMDEPNLIPLFNSYCWAAAEERPLEVDLVLPAEGDPFRRVFRSAGLVIDRGTAHYTVVSVHKGGITHHVGGTGTSVDAGVVARAGGRLYTTQSYNSANIWRETPDGIEVVARLATAPFELPSPLQFAVLRIATETVLRIARVRLLAKRLLVRRVITNGDEVSLANKRTIRFGGTALIKDEWVGDSTGFERECLLRPFSVLHMASQGYWQVGDDA